MKRTILMSLVLFISACAPDTTECTDSCPIATGCNPFAYAIELYDLGSDAQCDEVIVVGVDADGNDVSECHVGPYTAGDVVASMIVPYAVFCDGTRVRKILRSWDECQQFSVPECEEARW